MLNPSELSVIAKSPSPASWEKVVAAADALSPAEAADGVAALEDAVKDWSPDPARRWWSSMTAWRTKDAARWVSGELRRAPLAWMHEIMAGTHALKHSLLRAARFDGTKATATNAANLFASPHLHNLRVLDAGRDVKLARAFFKKLAAAKNLGALDTLVYYPLQFGGGEELAAAKSLGALKHLHLRAIVYSTDNRACTADVEALFAAPWISQLETLESCMGQSTGWSRLAEIYAPLRAHSARLTSLRRLVLSDSSRLDELVAAPVLDQIEEMVLQFESAKELHAVLLALEAREFPRLKVLDVSQQGSANMLPKKTYFEPMSESELRSLVGPMKLAKQAETTRFAAAE